MRNGSEGPFGDKEKALPALHLIRQFHFLQLLPEKTDVIRIECITHLGGKKSDPKQKSSFVFHIQPSPE